jgi:hypothetical protein
MKAGRSWLWVAGLLLTASTASLAGAQKDQVFRGEIGDSQCALNVHSLSRSHEEMLKKEGVGSSAADCTHYCVKNMGGVNVLQVKDKVYKIDDQDRAEKYAGMKVKLTGVLDAKTNVITVRSIEPLP